MKSAAFPYDENVTATSASVPEDSILRHLVTATMVTAATIIVFGIIYPLAMTGIAQVVFPNQANGSMLRVGGKIVGSDIVGQLWTQPQYFHGRLSAAGKSGYDPTATGGTNLGPTSRKLIVATRDAIDMLKKANPDATLPIPMDLVTSSGSGIDPDISPEAAYYEAPRIARTRKLDIAAVNAIIARAVHARELGVLGEPHVNVLELNLALDGKR